MEKNLNSDAQTEEVEVAIKVEQVDFASLKKQISEILTKGNIKKIIYIDDELEPQIEIDILVSTLLKLESESFDAIFNDVPSILEAPDEDTKRDEIVSHFTNIFLDEEKKSLLIKTLADNEVAVTNKPKGDLFETLNKLIHNNFLVCYSPSQWREKSTDLEKIVKKGPVLILCDQELKETERGIDIIKYIKESAFADQFYCAITSYTITDTQKELSFRKGLLQEEKYQDTQFFALAKMRKDDPVLLCDGIKKTILNEYLDIVKSETKKLIKSSAEKTITELDLIDTYDFDHSILRASLDEGVSEIDTLLRIIKVIFESEVKTSMGEPAFLKTANMAFKDSSKINEVHFQLSKGGKFKPPYDKRYQLRQLELYEDGTVVNKLHSQITNGDVFEALVTSLKGRTPVTEKKYFVVVEQECDIVLRKEGIRNRENNSLTVLPIEISSAKDISVALGKFSDQFGIKNYYLHNKFILDYFLPGRSGEYQYGIIDFTKPHQIDFNFADLIPLNDTGVAILNMPTAGVDFCDKDLLSTALENRMYKLQDYYANELKGFQDLYTKLKGIVEDELLSKLTAFQPCINNPMKFGTLAVFDPAITTYDFGFTRTKRLNPTLAKNILHKYNYYLSRFAEDHDFAREL